MNDKMTPKERYLAIVNRRKPDRVQLTYRATAEATEKLQRHLGCKSLDEVAQKLHIDLKVKLAPVYVGPALAKGFDVYGRQFRMVPYDGGAYDECCSHPLAGFETVEQIEASGYKWPSADWFDFSGIRKQVENSNEHVIEGGESEPFLVYKDLRGDEQAFMDLILYPEIVHHCIGKLYGFCYEVNRRIYEQVPGKVMETDVSEDMGAQDRLLYSYEHLKEYFFPYMKKMIDLAHEAGAKVNMHSDGSIREILPDLINLGIDILNPIQWRCVGMEREELKRDFGDKLIFEGGVDNQQTLPFGSVEDVRAEVKENLRLLGKNGGYLLGPCHNIQVVSPAENIVAMYETAYAEGWV